MHILKLINTFIFYALITSYLLREVFIVNNWELYSGVMAILLTALSFIPKRSREIYDKQGKAFTFFQSIVLMSFICIKFYYRN